MGNVGTDAPALVDLNLYVALVDFFDGLEEENGVLVSTSDVRIGGSPLPRMGALRHARVKRVQGPQYRVLRKEKANYESPPILPVARIVKRRVPVGP